MSVCREKCYFEIYRSFQKEKNEDKRFENSKFPLPTLVNVNAPVVATTSWWLHFKAPVVA